MNRVALIGNFPPRQCGIATFTKDLNDGLKCNGISTSVIAMNDGMKKYNYPPDVEYEIEQNEISSYINAANFLNTNNFKEFRISTLNGTGVKDKGMALFPRRINGSYMMLSRQDNESLNIMISDNPYFWYDYTPVLKPTYSWELIKLGNCGSPIEIDEGWLVLTHGVGPVRTYSLGAILLDKKEPWRVIGRLKTPLLELTEKERTGYVPNVLYTCGAIAIHRTLVLPYAIGDLVTTFAVVSIDEIINEMIS